MLSHSNQDTLRGARTAWGAILALDSEYESFMECILKTETMLYFSLLETAFCEGCIVPVRAAT